MKKEVSRITKWKDYRMHNKNNLNIFDYSLKINDKFKKIISNLESVYSKVNLKKNELVITDLFTESNKINPLDDSLIIKLMDQISSIKKIKNNADNINDLIFASNEINIKDSSSSSKAVLNKNNASNSNLVNKNKINIAIDGPAGSGKSTVARLIANKLNYLYINTGLIFRAIALNMLNKKIQINDHKKIKSMLKKDSIELLPNEEIKLNDINVSKDVRKDLVSSFASNVATIPFIRKYALKYQRKFAKNKGIVMDGRDIGTIVLPKAELKIFMWALPEIRAKRRQEQNIKLGFNTNYDQILEEIKRRDKNDTERKIAPLRLAKNSIKIDTTNKNIDDVIFKVLQLVNDKLESSN